MISLKDTDRMANSVDPDETAFYMSDSVGPFELILKGTVWSEPEVTKLFFVLNSAEHKIFSAYTYEHVNKVDIFVFISIISYLLAEKCSCSAMFNMKEIAIVSKLSFTTFSVVSTEISQWIIFHNSPSELFHFERFDVITARWSCWCCW